MYSDVKIRRRSIEDQKSAVIYLDTSSFISSTQCLRCSVIGEIVSAIAWVAQVTNGVPDFDEWRRLILVELESMPLLSKRLGLNERLSDECRTWFSPQGRMLERIVRQTSRQKAFIKKRRAEWFLKHPTF